MIPTYMVQKLWFPGPYIKYFSNYQEFEATQGGFIKKLTFSVNLGVFLQENLTFLTLMYLLPLQRLLLSEKYIMKAGIIDENNMPVSNI